MPDQGYSLIYKGPSTEEDPEKAARVADALSSRLPLSAEEARERLRRTPFALIGGLRRAEAERLRLFLQSFGAESAVREEGDAAPDEEPSPAHAVDPDRAGRRRWRGGFTAIIYTLAPGLALGAAIILAGAALIVAAHYWPGIEEPLWALSAAGGIINALGGAVLLGVVIFRLPVIDRLLQPPDLSTPLQALESYFAAVNARHWRKAERCLATRDDSADAGGPTHASRVGYFRRLHNELVLPEQIDAAGAAFVRAGKDAVELRVAITTIGRKPQADGSRLRRTVIDVHRFRRIDGAWYLLDPFLLGQPNPSRLPEPACRECGAEALLGQPRCGRCGAPIPPMAQESEQWLAPRRKPDLAALLSALVPGLGQAYNGQPLKGALIAATCWAILPWAAGVADAAYVAERINRKSSTHDVQRSPFLAMGLHAALFAAALILVLFNAERTPLLREIIAASRPAQEDVQHDSIVARFRGADASYSILFPYGWQVQEHGEEAAGGESGEEVIGKEVQALSPDASTSIIISTKPRTKDWAPCIQAMETRRKREEEGEEVANVECGAKQGREQYRLDSYTPDRRWRHTLLVLAYEQELVVLAFACPVERQDVMADVFNRVAESLRSVERSSTPITR